MCASRVHTERPQLRVCFTLHYITFRVIDHSLYALAPCNRYIFYCFTVTRSKKKYRRKKNRKLKTEGQSAIQTDSLSTIKNKLIRNGVHEVIENT